ncbi:MAG: hypothetical protein IT289_12200 [Oligoflexia bacterium]|nr:hypothetical protein [Oligoflexia bacterium]
MKLMLLVISFLFQTAAFAQSVAGEEAVQALNQYKNGAKVSGIEALLRVSKPKQIPPDVKSDWNQATEKDNETWKQIGTRWTAPFSGVLDGNFENHLRAWQLRARDIKSSADERSVEELISVLPENGDAKTWAQWQLAMHYGIENKTKSASRVLQSILDSDQELIDQNQVLLAVARIFYQENRLDLSAKYFRMIDKSSDYWLDSVEERAWITTKQKAYDKTLADLTTTLSSLWENKTGPESFFLAMFSNLKLCDYKRIFELTSLFKKRFLPRVVALQDLERRGFNDASQYVIDEFKDGDHPKINSERALKLPRFVDRDELLKREAEALQIVEDEQKENGNALTSVSLMNIKNRIATRFKQLARADLEEIKKNLTKIQLVEAEAIQRMHLNPKLAEKKGRSKISDGLSTIEFPYDEEVWLDELDNYHVDARGCPTKGG